MGTCLPTEGKPTISVPDVRNQLVALGRAIGVIGARTLFAICLFLTARSPLRQVLRSSLDHFFKHHMTGLVAVSCLLKFLLSLIMAHITSNVLLHRFRQMNLPGRPHSPHPRPSDKTDAGDGFHRPTPIDIIVARIMLTRSMRLPPELIDSIFDMAEYWAHSLNVIDYQAKQQDHRRINGSSRSEDSFLVSTRCDGHQDIDAFLDMLDALTSSLLDM